MLYLKKKKTKSCVLLPLFKDFNKTMELLLFALRLFKLSTKTRYLLNSLRYETYASSTHFTKSIIFESKTLFFNRVKEQ